MESTKQNSINNENSIHDKNSINNILKKRGLNSLILINTSLNKIDPNINYFLNKTFEYCVLVFGKDQKILMIPELEYGRAKSLENDGFNIKIMNRTGLKDIFDELKIRGNVGLNFESISLKEFEELKNFSKNFSKTKNKTKNKSESIIRQPIIKDFIDINSDLKSLRMIKNQKEIESIRAAAKIGDDIISKLFIKLKNNARTKEFKTEEDIMNFLNTETYKLGLKTSFKPIVASGKNSSNPHHDSRDTIKKGFCIIDFGVRYKGYCSDMTRTIYFGKPDDNEKRFYDLVFKANTECIDFSQSGKKCSDVDDYCRKILGKYSKNFIHGLGHGVGIEIHEAPRLGKKSEDILRDNMVFTIEPGLYFKNKFGIRIEDDVVLLKNKDRKSSKNGNYKSIKKEVLTNTTKELLCFDI